MGKFKVGDRVRVREWNSMVEEFGVNHFGNIPCGTMFIHSMRPYCGKITTVVRADNGNYLLDGCGNWIFTDDMLEAITEKRKKIIITTDGKKTVTAKLIDGKKTIRETIARCCDTNMFDFMTGAKLVTDRMFGVESQQEKPKFYNGKVVCIDNSSREGLYTVGKIYQFVDGEVVFDGKHYAWGKPFTSFEEFAKWTSAKFIEVVE